MYLELETILYNKLNELTLVDSSLKVITEGKAETPSIYISMQDANILNLNKNENYLDVVDEVSLGVTIIYDFKVKKDIKEYMYNWITKIHNKIKELEQQTITTTDYILNIYNYKVTNIMPRYESSQEGFLIMNIDINLQQIWR